MTKEMKKMLIIVGIIFSIIFGWLLVRKILVWYFMSHYQPPPVTISATVVKAQTWQSYLNSVGTLTAINGVNISSEASGIVKEIKFESGQFVHKGDPLVLLETGVEQAQLKNFKAQFNLAKLNYDRYVTLLKKNVISQSVLDTNLAQLREAEAGVEEIEARIRQKTIAAPFNGKIGIRLIDLGQYVSAGTSMVTLQSLDPLYVQFTLPEQYLPQVFLKQEIDINVNLASNKTLHSVKGVVTAIDAKVDQQTRSIKLQATIPNKDLQLFPGMFAEVKVWLKAQKNVIVVPQTAVAYSLYGDSVFTITTEDKLKKVHRTYVKVGERRGREVTIITGLKAGDEVVTSGQVKLDNNASVAIDNKAEL